MADTIIRLGDFEFANHEVPEQIAIGGEQHLATHDLVGGVRVVDAMGRADAPLSWSGLFLGESARDRARYLDGLRVAGAPLTLAWDQFLYQVVIASFTADFQRFYKLPYRISCTVVGDLSSPASAGSVPGIDQALREDMASANTLGGQIGDGAISSALGTLNSAISSVSNFSKATQSTINGVLAPLAAVQARVQVLTGSVGNVISNVATIGGILPNNPISQQVGKLTGQVAAMIQLPQLYSLQSVLGRMGGNLGAIGSSGQTVTQAGGNLYDVARQAYGDATAWPTIARANGLIDPQITGIVQLNIPKTPDGSGGILSA